MVSALVASRRNAAFRHSASISSSDVPSIVSVPASTVNLVPSPCVEPTLSSPSPIFEIVPPPVTAMRLADVPAAGTRTYGRHCAPRELIWGILSAVAESSNTDLACADDQ